MPKTIEPGQTFALRGTFGAGGTLIAESGNQTTPAGAWVTVHGAATNDGVLAFDGTQFRALGPTGATLAITGTLINDALISLAGGESLTGQPSGTVAGAELIDRGMLINAGTVTVGGALAGVPRGTFSNAAILRDTGVLTNSGLLSIDGGSNGKGRPAGGTVVVGGLLTNSGTISVRGGYNDISHGGVLRIGPGTLVNAGLLTVSRSGSGATDQATDKQAAGTLQVAGILTNTGTLSIAGGLVSGSGAGAYLVVASSGQLTNNGLFTIHGAYSTPYVVPYATGGTVNNQGMLTNAGTLEIGGSIEGSYHGYASPPGARLIDSGVLTNSGLLTIDAGDLYNGSASPGTLTVSGALNNAGILAIDSGQGDFYSSYDSHGALLIDNGTLTNTGTIVAAASQDGKYFSAATMEISGVLTNQGLIQLQAGIRDRYEIDTGATMVVGGTLINDGVISFGLGSYAELVNSGTLLDAGTITGQGQLINTGVISSGTNGMTSGSIYGDVYNNGTIEVAPNGALHIQEFVLTSHGDHGVFDIDAHGTLTLDDGVAANQEVLFAGIHSTLAIGYPNFFYATIAGLLPQTTIDFLRTDVTSATTSGTTLAIGLAAGGTLDLTLAQPLASYAVLSLASDGFGGTDLLVTRDNDAAHDAGSPAALSPKPASHSGDTIGECVRLQTVQDTLLIHSK